MQRIKRFLEYDCEARKNMARCGGLNDPPYYQYNIEPIKVGRKDFVRRFRMICLILLREKGRMLLNRPFPEGRIKTGRLRICRYLILASRGKVIRTRLGRQEVSGQWIV